MDLNGLAMPWPGVIRAYASPGLSTCLEEQRLCSDGSSLRISRLEIEALRLSEWASARGRALVLCPPDPLAPITELIAAAIHITDMSAYYRENGRALGSSRHVAVVTSDYRARGFYRGLGVRNPNSMSIAPFREVVPAATLGRDSVIRVLGSDPRNGWSTVFVPSIAALSSVPNVDFIVIDLPCQGVEGVLDLGVPVVMIASDPSDPVLNRVDGSALIFGWGRDDLERIQDDADLPPRLARRAAGGTVEVVAVPAHAVCENAALFWQDIGALMRAGGRSSVAAQLGREAFKLFHDLSGLALPLESYESLTSPVRVRLDAIGAATRLTRGDARDLYLPMVEVELRHLAEALGPIPPKRDVLNATLRELLDDHDDVMLIARTAEMARLHRADISRQGTLADVRVTSLGALSDENPADAAVLTGMAPTWARSVYRSGIATSIKVLAYTPEGMVESVANGYDEVERVRKTVSLQTSRETWFARPFAKDRVWSQLSGDARLTTSDDPNGPPEGDGADVPVTTPAPPDVPPGLWGRDGWLSDLEPAGSNDITGSDRGGLTRSGESMVPAAKVTFDDGRWTLMEESGTVTRFRPATGKADPAYPVSSVKTGDQLLFFDGDSRKDLLAKVIEVAVEVPALAVAAGWVAHWRRVLGAAYGKFGSYGVFAEALRDQGCMVQDQTIRLWVIGTTIGPDDEEDVHRVGVVMDDDVLRDNHDEVCRAIRSLRGAHVSLGQRLSEVAMRVGSAAAAGLLDADEVVDERSGLTVADFQESVDILVVHSTEVVGEVPYLLVGNLNEDSEEQEKDEINE
jgi:hypothetical protein